MNVKANVKSLASQVTHTLDPGLTNGQVMKRLILLIVIQFWYVMFALGAVLGTAENYADSGASKATVINKVWNVEHELWMNFASVGILEKTVFAVTYPLTVSGIWLAEIGIHIGYAIPHGLIDPFAMIVFEYGVPLIMFGLLSVYLFYCIDLAYRGSKELRELRGRLPQ